MKWNFLFLFWCCLFRQTSFIRGIRSVPNLGMGYSKTQGFRGMSIFFRGITKTVPSLFRGIFPERNFDGSPCVYTLDLSCILDVSTLYYYWGLCASWTSLQHRGLIYTWTCPDSSSLLLLLDVSTERGHELHVDVPRRQMPVLMVVT